MSCTRTQEYLADAKVTVGQQVDARKSPLAAAAALQLVEDVDEIYAAKGKNVVHYDLKKDRPSSDAIQAILIGPTGNLRAPTLRTGRTLVVGFNRAMYEKVIG